MHLVQALLLVAIIKYTPLTYNKDYEYPLSGQLLGGFLGVASTIWVPLYFMYSLIRAPGVKLREVCVCISASGSTVNITLRMISLSEVAKCDCSPDGQILAVERGADGDGVPL